MNQFSSSQTRMNQGRPKPFCYQTKTSGYEERIQKLEEIVSLLLDRTNPPWPPFFSLVSPTGLFRYSVNRGLVPVLSKAAAKSLMKTPGKGRPTVHRHHHHLDPNPYSTATSLNWSNNIARTRSRTSISGRSFRDNCGSSSAPMMSANGSTRSIVKIPFLSSSTSNHHHPAKKPSGSTSLSAASPAPSIKRTSRSSIVTSSLFNPPPPIPSGGSSLKSPEFLQTPHNHHHHCLFLSRPSTASSTSVISSVTTTASTIKPLPKKPTLLNLKSPPPSSSSFSASSAAKTSDRAAAKACMLDKARLIPSCSSRPVAPSTPVTSPTFRSGPTNSTSVSSPSPPLPVPAPVPSLHVGPSTTRPLTPETALADSPKRPADTLVSSKLSVTPTALVSHSVSQLSSTRACPTNQTTSPVTSKTTASTSPASNPTSSIPSGSPTHSTFDSNTPLLASKSLTRNQTNQTARSNLYEANPPLPAVTSLLCATISSPISPSESSSAAVVINPASNFSSKLSKWSSSPSDQAHPTHQPTLRNPPQMRTKDTPTLPNCSEDFDIAEVGGITIVDEFVESVEPRITPDLSRKALEDHPNLGQLLETLSFLELDDCLKALEAEKKLEAEEIIEEDNSVEANHIEEKKKKKKKKKKKASNSTSPPDNPVLFYV